MFFVFILILCFQHKLHTFGSGQGLLALGSPLISNVDIFAFVRFIQLIVLPYYYVKSQLEAVKNGKYLHSGQIKLIFHQLCILWKPKKILRSVSTNRLTKQTRIFRKYHHEMKNICKTDVKIKWFLTVSFTFALLHFLGLQLFIKYVHNWRYFLHLYPNIHCPKSNPYFRDITWNVVENMILHEIFRVVSRFPRYISCYIAENWFPLGQYI